MSLKKGPHRTELSVKPKESLAGYSAIDQQISVGERKLGNPGLLKY